VKYIALEKYDGIYKHSNGMEIGSLEDVRVLIRRHGLAAVAVRRRILNDTWQERAKHLRVWAARSESPLPNYVDTQDEDDESELEQPAQGEGESEAEHNSSFQMHPTASESDPDRCSLVGAASKGVGERSYPASSKYQSLEKRKEKAHYT